MILCNSGFFVSANFSFVIRLSVVGESNSLAEWCDCKENSSSISVCCCLDYVRHHIVDPADTEVVVLPGFPDVSLLRSDQQCWVERVERETRGGVGQPQRCREHFEERLAGSRQGRNRHLWCDWVTEQLSVRGTCAPVLKQLLTGWCYEALLTADSAWICSPFISPLAVC